MIGRVPGMFMEGIAEPVDGKVFGKLEPPIGAKVNYSLYRETCKT